MRRYIALALTILGISSTSYSSQSESKPVGSVVNRKEFMMMIKPVTEENCTLENEGFGFDKQNEKAWTFLCMIDVSEDALPFFKAGYEVSIRDVGGNFEADNISTAAQGGSKDVNAMPVRIMARTMFYATKDIARDAIIKLMNEDKLRLHMTFGRFVCSLNGVDVSQDRKLCPRD